MPHSPYNAPEKNARRFTDLGFGKEQAGFYGMIENIDENVGRLLAKLDEWKLTDNTLLIFMSDNGMTGGGSGVPGRDLAPGYPFFNAGQKGLKGTTDEGGVRVPFFVRWPGKAKAGREIDRIAAHIDVLPTLAAVAGARLPAEQVEGRNLLPLIEGKLDGWDDRFLFTHIGRWPVGTEPNDFKNVNFAVRNQRYRYVGAHDKAQSGPFLYDMESDPGQTKNVLVEHQDIANQMRAAYDQYWKEARPLMVNEAAPMSPTRPYHVWYKQQKETTGIPTWTSPEI